jgi:hypothetical protein
MCGFLAREWGNLPEHQVCRPSWREEIKLSIVSALLIGGDRPGDDGGDICAGPDLRPGWTSTPGSPKSMPDTVRVDKTANGSNLRPLTAGSFEAIEIK